MSFQIHALPAEPFAALFQMSDADLKKHRTIRKTVADFPGVPCRVTMEDAQPGETVVLTNYNHLPSDGAYHGSHAIYVREGKSAAHLNPDEVPLVLSQRTLSLRAMDTENMFVHAEVVEGQELDNALNRIFQDKTVAQVHIHYAGAGCFAARATRT